ncbi:MAG: accessory gene regulator B family protein [Clostridia bacterium]|nr:accessory gene regulator B family protein [Clostridia bacterium]
MYSYLSNKITIHFIKKGIIKQSDFENYAYGFEILISEIVYCLIMAIIALITHSLLTSLLFFLAFYIYRSVAGGYHAKTYLRCHIIFAINQLLCIGTIYHLPSLVIPYFCMLSLLLSAIITFLVAPIDHENKPFSEKEYSRYKAKSRYYILLSLLIVLSLLAFGYGSNKYCLAYCIGLLSGNLSVLYAKIARRCNYEKN